MAVFATSLLLAFSQIGFCLNVGPDYQHPIEGMSDALSQIKAVVSG